MVDLGDPVLYQLSGKRSSFLSSSSDERSWRERKRKVVQGYGSIVLLPLSRLGPASILHVFWRDQNEAGLFPF